MGSVRFRYRSISSNSWLLHQLSGGNLTYWDHKLSSNCTYQVNFARHGIPDTVITDNGLQFTSTDYRDFAKQWEFKHTTSSPLHPRANGKVERTVQTIKGIHKKATRFGEDPYLTLLNFRACSAPRQQCYWWTGRLRHVYQSWMNRKSQLDRWSKNSTMTGVSRPFQKLAMDPLLDYMMARAGASEGKSLKEVKLQSLTSFKPKPENSYEEIVKMY